MRGKISPKFHVKNGVKNGKFHADFTLLGRSAENVGRQNGPKFLDGCLQGVFRPKASSLGLSYPLARRSPKPGEKTTRFPSPA